MKITDIQKKLAGLSDSAPAPKSKPKKAPAPVVVAAPKTNGHTHLTPEESLAMHAARIVAAFNLEAKGVTVETLVAGVKQFEAPYQGIVQ